MEQQPQDDKAAAAAATLANYQSAMLNAPGGSQSSQMLFSAQYMAMLQSNDTINLTHNALAAGIPTLDIPTIISYLGYSNSFQSSPNSSFSSKYQKLLDVIEEIGRDVRPLYASSKGPSDRLRRQIIQARYLIRECLNEIERSQHS